MNVKKCLDILMRRLGNRTSPSLRATCLDEMVLVQIEELEGMEELPWFLISEQATTLTTPGEARIVLPTDFLREVEDDNLTIYDADGVKIADLGKVGYDEGRLQIPDDADPATPTLYSILGGYVILRPTPDIEYTIRYPSYYGRQPEPEDTADSENQWFKWVPGLLIAKTGVVVAGEILGDENLVQLFGAQQKRGMERLENMIVAREEANRSRRMG